MAAQPEARIQAVVLEGLFVRGLKLAAVGGGRGRAMPDFNGGLVTEAVGLTKA